ncbi:MAG: hypothetical protein ABJE95_02210 [Byssovorax sp.]
MSTPTLDPRLGRSEVAFPDPAALGWVVVVLGSAVLLGGLIMVLLFLFATPHKHGLTQDALAGAGMGAAMTLGGLALLVFAVRDLWRKPTWYFCERGLVRLSKTGPQRLTLWQDIERLEMVELKNAGRTIGYVLRGGPGRISVPNLPTMQRGYQLWKQGRAAAGRAA